MYIKVKLKNRYFFLNILRGVPVVLIYFYKQPVLSYWGFPVPPGEIPFHAGSNNGLDLILP